MRMSFNLIRLYAILSRPFIPDASDTMLKAVGCADDTVAWPDSVADALAAIPAKRVFSVPDNLFAKITDAEREQMAARYAGNV